MEATYYVEEGKLGKPGYSILGRDLTKAQADALVFARETGGLSRRSFRHAGPEQPGHGGSRNTGGRLVGWVQL